MTHTKEQKGTGKKQQQQTDIKTFQDGLQASVRDNLASIQREQSG